METLVGSDLQTLFYRKIDLVSEQIKWNLFRSHSVYKHISTMSKRQKMFEDYLPGRRKKIQFINTTQGKEETLEKSLY